MTSNTDCELLSVPRKAPPSRKDLSVVRSNGASFDPLGTETGYVPLRERRRGSATIEPLKRLKMAVLIDVIHWYRRNRDEVNYANNASLGKCRICCSKTETKTSFV
jgi:hypothetical protein